jgi:uncharacterized protein YndB with AHSA1/START domain
MILANETITIRRPLDDVFAFVANHENYARWFPGVGAPQSADALPHGAVGKRYHEPVSVPGRGTREMVIEVVEASPPHGFATESAIGPFETRMEIALEEAGGESGAAATQIRQTFSCRNRSPVRRLLFKAIAGSRIRRGSAQGLAALKQLLEEGQG